MGLADELRAVLRIGDVPWGTLTLWRRDGEPPFGRDDVDVVAGLVTPLAGAIRRCAQQGAEAWDDPHRCPGVLVLTADGDLLSLSDDAGRWLDEAVPESLVPSRLGVPLPLWVIATAFAAVSGPDGAAATRVRARSGGWLSCQASRLRDGDDQAGQVAVVVGPAAPSALTPLLVDAYGLSPREQEVTALIARGVATDEIAAELFLSVHTVRDHVKAIFAKVGVRSRGELVGRLLADHALPGHAGEVERV
jgi:DNA-binding CsgD family transcriptional regulator